MSREAFYAERDRRTVEYGVMADPFEVPAAIIVSADSAQTVAGQACALALVNMTARIHRRLRIIVPEAPLVVPGLVGGSSLYEEIVQLIVAIDPYNDLVVETDVKAFEVPPIAIGVGAVANVPLSVSADRYVATLSSEPEPFGNADSTITGAALASCIGAATLARMALGELAPTTRVSMWNFAEGEDALFGAEEWPGPLDVGNVAVIGAGAVASGLAYWTRYLGLVGDWVFVDGDSVKLHNTNRGLGLLARHAGWIDRELKNAEETKASVIAKLIGARSYAGWYDDWLAEKTTVRPDLVLPLANGPGLRNAVGQRGEAILLHGTTSAAWTADLHRHLAEDDGCISCRLPETAAVDLACGTSPLPGVAQRNDAALPFLSGAAGLLLLSALIQLANGRLPRFANNHWQLHLDLNARHTLSSRNWPCVESCGVKRNLPQRLRRALPRGERWIHLD